jgi:hypothetical protein
MAGGGAPSSGQWLHWSLLELGGPTALVGEASQFFFLCHQYGVGTSPRVLLCVSVRSRRLAVARSVLQASVSMAGGYGDLPVTWASKMDAVRRPQALCGIGLVRKSLWRRVDSGRAGLGFGT